MITRPATRARGITQPPIIRDISYSFNFLQVVEAIAVAVDRGLRVPIVYNTSSYDALSSLELMEGLVDIYMPDFKFWTAATSERLCKVRT